MSNTNKQPKQVPMYEHDCESCTYLGAMYDPRSKQLVDLYHCDDRTVIARYSSEPPDYSSGLTFSYDRGKAKAIPALKEARLRAEKYYNVKFNQAYA